MAKPPPGILWGLQTTAWGRPVVSPGALDILHPYIPYNILSCGRRARNCRWTKRPIGVNDRRTEAKPGSA